MLITKFIEIDMAHRVPNHKSKCQNLHGHRYRIEVGVDDKLISVKGDSSEGMVIDFSDLKAIMMEKIDAIYDHNSIFYELDLFGQRVKELSQGLNSQKKEIILVSFIPTAENLAEHWFNIINEPLKQKGIKLKFVRVYETPTSTATYEI